MQNNQNGYVGHEEANRGIIADSLGPIADQLYRTPPGEPTFTQQYGNQISTQGSNITNNLRQSRMQQNAQTNNSQFSGYGNQEPNYNHQGGNREWRMINQSNSDLYKRLPKVYGKAIVAVNKNGQGDIQAFKLEDGTVLDYRQVLQAGADNALSGLRIQNNREGELIIRSVPDGFTDNNLDNLPLFQ